MKIIYKTQTKQWMIVEQEDALWKQVFGTTLYGVCKFYEHLKTVSDGGWVVLWTDASIENCFKYLRESNVISQDEMKHQLSLLTK